MILPPRPCHRIEPALVLPWRPNRPRETHKGLCGNVGIVGGAPGMAGAALLAARAALWMGAGRVFCGLLEARIAVDLQAPEIMVTAPRSLLAQAALDCLVLGPGLGTTDEARSLLDAALASPVTLVLDADALNLIASDQALHDTLRERHAGTLITPHPGEAGRLLGQTTDQVQADRAQAVQGLSGQFNVLSILKGADTLVHWPGSPDLWRNSSGNPGMAAPGMGDVLAGMIGGLIGQGLSLDRAARLGVYLHGAAADALVAEGIGPLGLTASEVAQRARTLLNQS